jgi:hypothetical protein
MAYRRGMGTYVASVPCATGVAPGAKAAGMGCACGCDGGLQGFTMDGSGLFGTGLFAGGFDPATWGMGEYVALLFGGYMVFSLFHTTTVATRATRRKSRAVRKALAA